ncbi:radical SAM protein [Methylophilaceae bacterium]|nr:radical SAM protein [Methylophilaceae bacterium]
MKKEILTIFNHDRNIFSSKYIYPVVSRRSMGLSLGINLNTNNACNWQCIYCQVSNLTRGKPEKIDLKLLENELDKWLEEIVNGSFLIECASHKVDFKDIAFSGNGEPTASTEFEPIVKIVLKKIDKFQLSKTIKLRLITNGSYLNKKNIQHSLEHMKSVDHEVWFKIDHVNPKEALKINRINLSIASLRKNLQSAISISPTIVQTCLLKVNKKLPSEDFVNEYIKFLAPYAPQLKAIHLYSMVRPSQQKTDLQIDALDKSELQIIADKINVLKTKIECY